MPPLPSNPAATPAGKEDKVWWDFDHLPETMPSWLVQDLIPAHSLICLYGKRGQGKTFLALDWACCIATGTAWQEIPVQRGRVAYLLAERPAGLKRRLMGWLHHVQTDGQAGRDKFYDDGIDWLLFAQKRFALDNLSLSDPTSIDALLGMLEAQYLPVAESAPLSRRLSLLVLDPLVFFMDGSENETRDMQAFVNGALKIVERLKCSVLLVHHEGKGNKQNALGARGSSALEAGMDTVIYLSEQNDQGVADLKVTKQREAPAGAPMRLAFKEAEHAGQRLGTFPTRLPPATAEEQAKRGKKNGAKKETITPDGILAIIRDMDSRGEPITITRINNQIPTDLAVPDLRLRGYVGDLVKRDEIWISKPAAGSRPAVYSVNKRSDGEPIQPTAAAAPCEVMQP